MRQRFMVVPAAYVILRRGDEVLLQLRHNTGYMDDHWASSAAGHVEAGESVLEAAVRETHEELGLSIRPADLVPLCTMHRTSHDGDALSERADFFFSIEGWVGEPIRAEPHKSAEIRWFGLGDLPASVVPFERFVLDQLADGGPPPIVTHGF